ncbi:hypothetical protein CC80DRAFT_498015 [Byssothecium circinans]|uniref:Uncharacterized protein n=1 Tax=Byssothecium circinans TaxID=147558 RepID=A0A6A5T825_9PLEO|nr:hypothetical protein CC80DRAFT_498015 [Byssothecium circinans]
MSFIRDGPVPHESEATHPITFKDWHHGTSYTSTADRPRPRPLVSNSWHTVLVDGPRQHMHVPECAPVFRALDPICSMPEYEYEQEDRACSPSLNVEPSFASWANVEYGGEVRAAPNRLSAAAPPPFRNYAKLSSSSNSWVHSLPDRALCPDDEMAPCFRCKQSGLQSCLKGLPYPLCYRGVICSACLERGRLVCDHGKNCFRENEER